MLKPDQQINMLRLRVRTKGTNEHSSMPVNAGRCHDFDFDVIADSGYFKFNTSCQCHEVEG